MKFSPVLSTSWRLTMLVLLHLIAVKERLTRSSLTIGRPHFADEELHAHVHACLMNGIIETLWNSSKPRLTPVVN